MATGFSACHSKSAQFLKIYPDGKLFEKSSFYALPDEAFCYENFIFGVQLVTHG
jgi:hypothetical protein